VTGTILACVALLLALLPALMVLLNLRHCRRPPDATQPPRSVSVLIPARDEERSVRAAVESALASRGVTVEVIVLDDHSTDATAAIVRSIADNDGRVRLFSAPALPPGWCGKQHACAVLARQARHDLLAFLDADVRLAPDGLARLAAFQQASGADLVSGIPRQETETLFEKLLIPLIHFVLLGFLPMGHMRRSNHPAYGSGCGQLFLARRAAYEEAGGHASIRMTLHDGIKLPRAFRAAGKRTDLCDATDVATCRMYRGAAQTWRGLAKNATEGLASPGMIGPATLLLFGGQVLPFVLLCGAALLSPVALIITAIAAILALLPRLLMAWRFRQSWLGALLHPLGVSLLLAIQWYALIHSIAGKPATWKGRAYRAAA
jgi:hypothetical protein